MIENHKSGLLIAAATLAILLGATYWFWHSTAAQNYASGQQRFQYHSTTVVTTITQRLERYEQLLVSGAAFLDDPEAVSREEWRRYVNDLRLNEQFPGIQGLGYAQVLEREEIPEVEQEARADGLSHFAVWPEGERSLYTTIRYLEPEDWRNQRAIGYDMFSEPVRRRAMEQARDTGSVAATGIVSLVQEDGTNQQPGFLLYFPIYRGNEQPTTEDQRAEQLQGFVYGAFRFHDLMVGLFGESSLPYRRMQIFEGPNANDAEQIYDSEAANPELDSHEPMFTTIEVINFNGAYWTLRFTSLPEFEKSIGEQRNWYLIGGIVFSVLMSGFIWALWTNLRRGSALSSASLRLLHEANQREYLKEELRQFFSISPDILCTLDTDGTFRQVNAACERILGIPAATLENMTFSDTAHPDDRHLLTEAFTNLRLKKVHRITREVRNVTASGSVRWIDWSFVAADRADVYYGYGRDVTERKQMEQQLHHNAFHDTLTGVANRALLLDRLSHVIERAHRFGEHYAVFILDIDNFKSINDSYGHLVGDKLLVSFADRIAQQLRPVDTCARFGGDEFTLLIEETSDEEAARSLADRILTALQEVFVVDGHEFYIGSSIGIALDHTSNGYEAAEQVIKHADLALYEAKKQGKGRYVIFDERMQSEQVSKAQMESDLRQALIQKDMVVHYQPIIDLHNGRIAGCEALVRWEHPERGRITPEKFIPIAESSGLITQLSRHVTEVACHTLSDWRRHNAVSSDFFISVNLSPREVFLRDSVDFIQHLLMKYKLQGHNLRVEVTEGVLIERDEEASVIFSRLRELGVRIYIDDFGTGYSSLSYLRTLPIDGIKLDRSFVEQIRSTRKSQEIARTVLELAKVLDLQSVVEGVETEDQLQFVKKLGFGFAQGFGLHCPMPELEMSTLMHHHRYNDTMRIQ